MPDDNGLQTSQLFLGVPQDIIQAALAASNQCEVKRGSYFYRTDESANRLFVLVSGRVKLRLVTASGYRMLFRFIAPGDFFGYQAVFQNSAHYFTSAEAATDCKALCWSRAAARRLLRSHPAIAVNALSISLMRMQEYQERLAEMACEAVPTRIARRLIWLQRYGATGGASFPVTINGEFTREDLAGLAGSTLHTVSRILGVWERAHIVEKSRGTIRIIAPAKLAQIAGF